MKHAILAMGPTIVTSARFFWTGMAASWTGCYRDDLKYAIVRSRPSPKERRAQAARRCQAISAGAGRIVLRQRRNASFERLPSVSAYLGQFAHGELDRIATFTRRDFGTNPSASATLHQIVDVAQSDGSARRHHRW